MKTVKELLIIVRDNIEDVIKNDCDFGGICATIYELNRRNIMNDEEIKQVLSYIHNNKPRNAYKRKITYAGKSDKYGFALASHWWTPRAIKPRIKWLNKQIDKL